MAVQASSGQYYHLQPPILDHAIFAADALPAGPSTGIAGASAYALANIGHLQQQQHQELPISSTMLPFTGGATPTAHLGSSRKRARDHPIHDAASGANVFGHMIIGGAAPALNQGTPAGLLPTSSAQPGRSRSAVASTSGRPQTTTPQSFFSVLRPLADSAPDSNTVPLHQAYLLSQFQQHSLDVDQLLRLHDEKLRLALRDVRRRHSLAILAASDRAIQPYLDAKQSELRAALIRKSELEEQLRQAEAQRQAWAAEANKGDAMVNELYTRLNQLTMKKTLVPVGGSSCAEEGSGDNGDKQGMAYEAEEGESRCSGWVPNADAHASGKGINIDRDEKTTTKAAPVCRACCRGKDACVLLLPCRHLCLCAECDEAEGGTPLPCPVCGVHRNASMRIAPCP